MAVLTNNLNDVNLATALGAAPGANDEVNITQHNTAFNNVATTINFDLLKMLIGPMFYGGFSASLLFTCNQASTGSVEVRGGGQDFIMGSTATANVHNEVFVKLARPILLTYTACTMNKLRHYAGRLFLENSCVATDVIHKFGDLTLDGGVAPPTTTAYLGKGGSLTNNRIITTGSLDGDSLLTMDNAAGGFGTLNWAGKYFTWLRGNITTKLNAYSGTIDMRGLKAAPTIADYLIGEDVTVLLPPKNIMANPFTNAAKYIGGGPKILHAS